MGLVRINCTEDGCLSAWMANENLRDVHSW